MGPADETVGPTIQLERRLAPTPFAPGDARRCLRELRGIEEPTLEAARLLVSELVTNAIRHGGLTEQDEIHLLIRADQGCVRIEVGQPTGTFEGDGGPAHDGTSGWGLFLVDALSHRWGVDRRGGTRVWFELDRSGPTVSRLSRSAGSERAAPP